jgi:hypothetical protein
MVCQTLKRKAREMKTRQDTDTWSPPKELDEHVERQLDACRTAFEAGNIAGLMDAIQICLRQSRPLPRWAPCVKKDSPGVNPSGSRRGHFSRGKLHIQDMIDLARYDTVIDCREHGIKHDELFDVASRILRGNRAAGAPDAIEASYERVKRGMKRN